MVLKRKSLLSKTIPFLLLGLLVFVLYLVFFVNIDEMVATIAQTILPIYLLSIIATVAETVFFAFAWHYFLKPLSAAVSFMRAFIYSWVSNFVDLLIPAESVSGEICRIYFITRDGVDPGKAVASVVTQRVVNMLLTILAITASAIHLLILHISFSSLVQSLIILVIASGSIFLSITLVLCSKENWMQKIIDTTISIIERVSRNRWNLEVWREKARKGVRAFYDSLKIFRKNPKKLVLPVGFSLLSWFSSILVYYLVFAAIGYALDWTILVMVYSLVVALKSIPIGVPTEVGVAEIAMTTLFIAFNVPPYVSGAATILIRIVTVWFRLIIGFGAVQWVGAKTILNSEPFIGEEK